MNEGDDKKKDRCGNLGKEQTLQRHKNGQKPRRRKTEKDKRTTRLQRTERERWRHRQRKQNIGRDTGSETGNGERTKIKNMDTR